MHSFFFLVYLFFTSIKHVNLIIKLIIKFRRKCPKNGDSVKCCYNTHHSFCSIWWNDFMNGLHGWCDHVACALVVFFLFVYIDFIANALKCTLYIEHVFSYKWQTLCIKPTRKWTKKLSTIAHSAYLWNACLNVCMSLTPAGKTNTMHVCQYNDSLDFSRVSCSTVFHGVLVFCSTHRVRIEYET